jgi:hypothetical protein
MAMLTWVDGSKKHQVTIVNSKGTYTLNEEVFHYDDDDNKIVTQQGSTISYVDGSGANRSAKIAIFPWSGGSTSPPTRIVVYKEKTTAPGTYRSSNEDLSPFEMNTIVPILNGGYRHKRSGRSGSRASRKSRKSRKSKKRSSRKSRS